MTTLADVATFVKEARVQAQLTQKDLAERAGVSRTTLNRMETLAKSDMSVLALLRVLSAAGYELKAVKRGHTRTLTDVLAEQRENVAS